MIVVTADVNSTYNIYVHLYREGLMKCILLLGQGKRKRAFYYIMRTLTDL